MFAQQLSGRASSTLWAEGGFELILNFFSLVTTCEQLFLNILDQRCPSLSDLPWFVAMQFGDLPEIKLQSYLQLYFVTHRVFKFIQRKTPHTFFPKVVTLNKVSFRTAISP